MSVPTNVAAVKIYFDIKDDQIGLYRSLRVQKSTTFDELHSKISSRIGISKKRSVFFHLALRYTSPVTHPRVDYVPSSTELVLATVEREETSWSGEIILIYIDVRSPASRMIETGSANAEVQRASSMSNMRLTAMQPMTEFFSHSDGTEKCGALTDSIVAEIENICIKRGKLNKMLMGKESVWRYMMYLY